MSSLEHRSSAVFTALNMSVNAGTCPGKAESMPATVSAPHQDTPRALTAPDTPMTTALPIIQDLSAIVADSAAVGEGTFIGKNVVINAEARIGRHCIINTGAIIEHECNISDFSHISVGTTLCGKVQIGRNCMIGSRSTVIQCVNVGNSCVVGAGTVVNKDLPDDCTAVGVPARVL